MLTTLSAPATMFADSTGLMSFAFLPAKSWPVTPRALAHIPHMFIGVPLAMVVAISSLTDGKPDPMVLAATSSFMR